MSELNLKNWRIARDESGIAWVTIDVADSAANTLGSGVLRELALVLDALDRDPPKAMVIQSGKAAGFIAGADLEEYAAIEDVADIKAIVARN